MRAIQKGNNHIGIIEMGFTAGENLEFCLCTRGIDFYGSYITL